MSKLQMKKTVLLNIAALTAAVAMGNTTWYRNCNMNTANKAYLQKLQYWNNANGQTGSGDVSATDDLVLNGSIESCGDRPRLGFELNNSDGFPKASATASAAASHAITTSI